MLISERDTLDQKWDQFWFWNFILETLRQRFQNHGSGPQVKPA